MLERCEPVHTINDTPTCCLPSNLDMLPPRALRRPQSFSTLASVRVSPLVRIGQGPAGRPMTASASPYVLGFSLTRSANVAGPDPNGTGRSAEPPAGAPAASRSGTGPPGPFATLARCHQIDCRATARENLPREPKPRSGRSIHDRGESDDRIRCRRNSDRPVGGPANSENRFGPKPIVRACGSVPGLPNGAAKRLVQLHHSKGPPTHRASARISAEHPARQCCALNPIRGACLAGPAGAQHGRTAVHRGGSVEARHRSRGPIDGR